MTTTNRRQNLNNVPVLRVIGLMSGTSLDGCDAVLAEISAHKQSVRIRTIDFITHPMPHGLREKIVKQLKPENSRIDELTQLDAALGIWFVDAVDHLLEHAGLKREDIDLIGSHGQTMWHDVQPRTPDSVHMERMTWQLGDGSFISARTGITTVCDFRTADVALGGQGAPLMPVFDQLVYGNDRPRSIALQNIGGIGNVSVLPKSSSPAKVMGFDTGPGNMIIDRFAEKITEGQLLYDEDGKLAAQGNVNELLLQDWLRHPFFQLPPPKSTGREQFGYELADAYWQEALGRGVSSFDAIATATALTAKTIALSYEQAESIVGVYPDHVVVAGGGARNITLMRMLASFLRPGTSLVRAGDTSNFNPGPEGNNFVEHEDDDVPYIHADSKEAVAFAVFAYQALCGRPNHLPSTTGASRPIILGKICPGDNFQQVLLQSLPRHYSRPVLTSSSSSSSSSSSAQSVTETRNYASMGLDSMAADEIVHLINQEDIHVAQVVASLQPTIAKVAQEMSQRIKDGGRVFYIGAGTSGRLGVLDASEIPPTFSAPSSWFQGMIAGGDRALRSAVENAEDNEEQGAQDILAKDLRTEDMVIGIAASGTTPYVHAALAAAKQAVPAVHTVFLSCNHLLPAHILEKAHTYVDTWLTALVGPEILTGSTRMKAGTATKLILNQLSTVAMILMGKTFGNLMVDLRVSNNKLRKRAIGILQTIVPALSVEQCVDLLQRADYQVKVALTMQLVGCATKEEACALLQSHGGRLGEIVSKT